MKISMTSTSLVLTGHCLLSVPVLIQKRYCYCEGFHRPSPVNFGFLENACWIQNKFYGKLAIHYTFRPFGSFVFSFYFSSFTFCFRYYDTLWARNVINPYCFHEISTKPKAYDIYLRHGGIQAFTFMIMCQNLRYKNAVLSYFSLPVITVVARESIICRP